MKLFLESIEKINKFFPHFFTLLFIQIKFYLYIYIITSAKLSPDSSLIFTGKDKKKEIFSFILYTRCPLYNIFLLAQFFLGGQNLL